MGAEAQNGWRKEKERRGSNRMKERERERCEKESDEAGENGTGRDTRV